MELKLNGWQRLFVLAAGIWTVAAMVAAYMLWPPLIGISSVRGEVIAPDGQTLEVSAPAAPSATDLQKIYTYAAETSVPITPESEPLPTTVVMTDGTAHVFPPKFDLKRAEATVKQQANAARRRSFARTALAAWSVPPIIVYVLGWSIAWIRRGLTAAHTEP